VDGISYPRNGLPNGIIPLSSLRQISNNIIQKGLAFVREQSGSVTVSGRQTRLGILPPPAVWPRWGCGGGGDDAAPTEDPDVKTHRYATYHFVRGFAAR
jgi:hypothetical protein